MTNHFKIFATQADYEAYIAGEHATPLVAYISATGKCVLPEGSGGGGNQLLRSIDIDDFTGTTYNDVATYITEATIPNGVTKIADSAFQACRALTSVRIPDTVTFIGNSAFSYCTALTSVDIGNSVTTIGDSAFQGCSGLTSVTIPNSVTIIGGSAFQGCSDLTSVDIGNSATLVGGRAFMYCHALTSVTVRATTPPSMQSSAFNNTNDTFIIYVPAASVEAYKAASGWSAYASRIQAISE